MECPYCNSSENKVVDKRTTDNGIATRRRRECITCEKRFTTYERVEDSPVTVIKKDGRKEQYTQSKLRGGLKKALGSVDEQLINKTVAAIEMKMRNYKSQEVRSKVLGRWALQALRKIDKLAYLRFASIHKDIEDLEELREEISKLSR